MKEYYIGLDGGSTYLKAALLRGRSVVDTMVRACSVCGQTPRRLFDKSVKSRRRFCSSVRKSEKRLTKRSKSDMLGA